MQRWSEKQAETRFSAMLSECLARGPRFVTRHGIDTTVLMRVDEWHRLSASAHASLKQLLLAEGERCDPIAPLRGRASRRTTAALR
jgi:hypothetical protein